VNYICYTCFTINCVFLVSIAVVALSNAKVCGCTLACDCGFEFRRDHGGLSVVGVSCLQVVVTATSRSLIQRSPTDYGVLYHLESSRMIRPLGTLDRSATGKKIYSFIAHDVHTQYIVKNYTYNFMCIYSVFILCTEFHAASQQTKF
jgi:hypothetical protein